VKIERKSIEEIFEQDILSLARVLKAVQRTDDVILSELLRTEHINQSAVFKSTLLELRKKLYDLESLVIKVQSVLQVPESLRKESEIF
jgi:hypothetical protein